MGDLCYYEEVDGGMEGKQSGWTDSRRMLPMMGYVGGRERKNRLVFLLKMEESICFTPKYEQIGTPLPEYENTMFLALRHVPHCTM